MFVVGSQSSIWEMNSLLVQISFYGSSLVIGVKISSISHSTGLLRSIILTLNQCLVLSTGTVLSLKKFLTEDISVNVSKVKLYNLSFFSFDRVRSGLCESTFGLVDCLLGWNLISKLKTPIVSASQAGHWFSGFVVMNL